MVTTALKTAAFSQDTDEGVLVLLTIDHDDISPPIRVVNNTEHVASRGNTFIAFPFSLVLPSSDERSPPVARLTIDNVSREIAQSIRLISTAPDVLIEVVRMKDTEVVELSFPGFRLRNVKWDASTVSGDLVVEDIAQEPYPAFTFSPADFPGLLS